VDDALVFDQKARVRVAALDRHVAAKQEADRLAKMRFESGSYTQLDVFAEDRQLYGAQNEEIHGVLDEYLALVSVYKAMGGGWMMEEDKKPASGGTPAPASPAAARLPSTTQEVAAK
jgi:outer membrane protein, multidrug efflux system